MDTISSAEFRKQYAKLTEPTAVTVNGHAIGVWSPSVPDAEYQQATRDFESLRTATPDQVGRYSSRPFTPVPKRGK